MRTKNIFMPILAAAIVTSCVTEDKLLTNKLYWSADGLKTEVRIQTDEGVTEASREVAVSVAFPLDHDLRVSFVESPELMESYRQAYYSPDAELLTEEHYDIDNLAAVIKAGAVTSSPVEVRFKNLGVSDLDYSKEYVLPLTIQADGIDIMQSSKTMYFVIREAFLVNVVGDISENRAWPVWDDFEQVKNLETLTMEALVYNHNFDNGIVEDGEESWNSDGINTIMGVEEHFLLRIGDSTIPENQVQVACSYKDEIGNTSYRLSVTSPSLQLQKDRWYHIAVTFDRGKVNVYLDGVLEATGDVSEIGYSTDEEGNQVPVQFTSVNFGAPHSEEDDGKPRCFWVGYSYQPARYLDGMISEVRVWNRVLSEEEINSPGHFYKLYPEDIDESLLAYWKFDEGEGKTVYDHSQYGYDLTADHDLVWYPVELK